VLGKQPEKASQAVPICQQNPISQMAHRTFRFTGGMDTGADGSVDLEGDLVHGFSTSPWGF
jgi:hypothetical protein